MSVLSLALMMGLACADSVSAASFTSDFADTHDRVWTGKDYWANPMENWRIAKGRLECISGTANHNVALLTYAVGSKKAGFRMSVDIEQIQKGKAAGYLPTVKVTGMKNPVVQVINEKTGQIVYTTRIVGDSFSPKVFADGTYTVKVGDPDTNTWKTIKGNKPEKHQNQSMKVKY